MNLNDPTFQIAANHSISLKSIMKVCYCRFSIIVLIHVYSKDSIYTVEFVDSAKFSSIYIETNSFDTKYKQNFSQKSNQLLYRMVGIFTKIH